MAARALNQAQKFGARLLTPRRAVAIDCDSLPYRIVLDDGASVRARAIVIATGARYRKLPIATLPVYEGRGVYYGATAVEARLCGDDEVVVVGGGNSAGQAAVFLARNAPHVHILVRRDGLASTMSRYLIARIEATENITLHPHTEVVDLQGDGHLQWQRWETPSGTVERNARHLFVMIGATPNTDWLEGCVALDSSGFVLAGEAARPTWPLPRAPLLLETSQPRIFAVGDVRSGSVKRVASAVGEGSMCIRFVHEILSESFQAA